MQAAGSGPTRVELGMGSDVANERGTSHPGDSSDVKVVHRFDKTSYHVDIGKLQCSCEACDCGDNALCIEKRCLCCTVIQ